MRQAQHRCEDRIGTGPPRNILTAVRRHAGARSDQQAHQMRRDDRASSKTGGGGGRGGRGRHLVFLLGGDAATLVDAAVALVLALDAAQGKQSVRGRCERERVKGRMGRAEDGGWEGGDGRLGGDRRGGRRTHHFPKIRGSVGSAA